MKNRMGMILISLFSFITAYAQEFNQNDTLKLDLDFDKKADTVIFDKVKAIIVCKLSTQKFREIKSLELAFEEPQSHIRASGTKFTYSVPHMRAGYHCDFAYNKALKKIQLVGMDRYEFGPANNDGSGESSVDLLTNNYIGDWNYYDLKNNELIEMPAIKRKMVLPKTYLEAFDDEIVYQYINWCVKLFETEKTNRIEQSKTAKFKHTFSDASGQKTVLVKIYNPCDLATPPWDADKNFIEAKLINGKKTLSVKYDNPVPEMSLIFFDQKEISVQKVNGASTVFIPFYYCGNSEDHDKNVSYIIFYKGVSYTCHLLYTCKNNAYCKLQQEQKTMKGLPIALKKYLIQYSNTRHRNNKSFHQDE